MIFKYLPLKLVVAPEHDQLVYPLPRQYTAAMGGWCDTYSAKNYNLSVTNSKVSPRSGLNGFEMARSTIVYWVAW